MKTRKIPLRTCVVTGEKLDKRDLLRVVKNKEGEVKVDLTGKMNGRGAYIKRDVKVLDEAIKKKSLERKLECNISNEVYDEIRKILE
ncbi:MAG TPA: YlxR family protein [Candidatus Onthousia excrementipullorum]|uniref:YlxR family protein n=1 Tax=Candidatus Onthousia excrementipullorum TaxID=2840884 RepID=A0A9D1DTD2_9FIRM|nr:YlxR family protein [Candidatus Onthousia excrementipullorum]